MPETKDRVGVRLTRIDIDERWGTVVVFTPFTWTEGRREEVEAGEIRLAFPPPGQGETPDQADLIAAVVRKAAGVVAADLKKFSGYLEQVASPATEDGQEQQEDEDPDA